MYFHFTIDVDWIPGSEIGLKKLLDFCDVYNLKATLFLAGRFVEEYPEIVQDAVCRGHELGTHGWEHGLNPNENFRLSTYEQQKEWIQLSTEIVEKKTGIRPKAFRAPNLWVSETTFRVLEEEGYLIDSSVPARRYDLGIGMVNYTRFYWAPLEPYSPSIEHLGIRGDSPIKEIVPSAFWIPVNMSALRVMGFNAVTWAVRRIARRSSVLVFYLHPSEFVNPEDQTLLANEPSRHSKGIGPENFESLSRFVKYVIKLGYSPSLFSRYLK